MQPVVFHFLPRPVFVHGQLNVDVTLRVEGEGCGGVTVVATPAGGTLAFVSVLPFVGQQRDTVCSVLAHMLSAAQQKDIAVVPTPRLLAGLWLRAVTSIGVGSVLARGTILARITVTLINVNLTVCACEGKHVSFTTEQS